MKKVCSVFVLVLFLALVTGCGPKGLPVIGKKSAPVATVENGTSKQAVSAFEGEMPISEEIQRFLDEDILGREDQYYTVKVDVAAAWYHDWADVFHAVVGEACFSRVPETESEAAFWTAVHQIPKDTHPDDFSGILKIPCSCEEAKEWAGGIAEALNQNRNDAWGGWVGKLAEILELYPEYDFRQEE